MACRGHLSANQTHKQQAVVTGHAVHKENRGVNVDLTQTSSASWNIYDAEKEKRAADVRLFL